MHVECELLIRRVCPNHNIFSQGRSHTIAAVKVMCRIYHIMNSQIIYKTYLLVRLAKIIFEYIFRSTDTLPFTEKYRNTVRYRQ